MATLTSAGVNFSDGSTINGTTTNAIGSYVIAGTNTSGTYTYGSTISGSSLRLIGLQIQGVSAPDANYRAILGYSNGTSASGTWRMMGYSRYFNCCGFIAANGGLWVRIS